MSELEYLEKEMESLKAEIKETKAINKDIKDLAMQTRELAIEMKHMRETQEEHSERLAKLEEKPLKRYDNIINIILSCIISAAVGAVLVLIGIK